MSQNLDLIDDAIALLKRFKAQQSSVDPDLIAARLIAAEQSTQTGKNYQNFTSGRYDHAFGVRTALAAIKYGRRTQ
jgi:hypothetical protein